MSDPLNFAIDLNDTDTSMPVLIEGSYIAKIASAEIIENNDKNGHNLKVIFETTAPATSISAQERGLVDDVKPGFKLRRYYPMQPSLKNPDFDFRKGLAELQDAALKCERGARPPFSVADLNGKELIIRVKARMQTSGPYADTVQNDVAGVRALS